MNPWNLIGWIVAIFLLLGFAPLVARLAYALLAELPVAFAKDFLSARRERRAHSGKVTCQHTEIGELWEEPCANVATRKTPNGFYCEEHYRRHTRKMIMSGSVSYAFLLDWYKPEYDLKMRDRA